MLVTYIIAHCNGLYNKIYVRLHTITISINNPIREVFNVSVFHISCHI